MIAVTVLISTYLETRNNHLSLGDIRALRTTLRELFVDLRLNTLVWKFIWDFIDNLEVIRGAVNGTTVNRKLPAQHKPAALGSPSTANSIAPARKRGRPTAKIKALSVLPHPISSIIKSEETTFVSPSDLRSPKRQRNDLSPTDNVPLVEISSQHLSTSSQPPINANAFEGDHQLAKQNSVIELQPSSTQAPPSNFVSSASAVLSSIVPLPRRTSSLTQSPPYQPVLKPAMPHIIDLPPRTGLVTPLSQRSHNPRSGMLPNTTALPLQVETPRENQITQVPTGNSIRRRPSNLTSYAPERTMLLSPGQVRQTRISSLHGYKAPAAQMGTSNPAMISSPFIPASPVALPDKLGAATPESSKSSRQQTRKGMSNLRSGIGAFTPSHSEAQWAGVEKPISPTIPPLIPSIVSSASAATLPTSIIPNGQSPRPNRQRHNTERSQLLQFDGAIDLTSDTELEQERQDLLSSFKANSVAAKQRRSSAAGKPVAASLVPVMPTAQGQQHPTSVQDINVQELPIKANHYAKFKKHQRQTSPASWTYILDC